MPCVCLCACGHIAYRASIHHCPTRRHTIKQARISDAKNIQLKYTYLKIVPYVRAHTCDISNATDGVFPNLARQQIVQRSAALLHLERHVMKGSNDRNGLIINALSIQ